MQIDNEHLTTIGGTTGRFARERREDERTLEDRQSQQAGPHSWSGDLDDAPLALGQPVPL